MRLSLASFFSLSGHFGHVREMYIILSLDNFWSAGQCNCCLNNDVQILASSGIQHLYHYAKIPTSSLPPLQDVCPWI